jgi:hypothetical protein
MVANRITNMNGPGVLLQTDGTAGFAKLPVLRLPDETASSQNHVYGNWFTDNNNYHLILKNTTESWVYDNYFGTKKGESPVYADNYTAASTKFEAPGAPVRLMEGESNVVGGEWLAGNWWCDDGGHATTNASHDGVGADRPYVVNKSAGAVDRLPLFIRNNYGMC